MSGLPRLELPGDELIRQWCRHLEEGGVTVRPLPDEEADDTSQPRQGNNGLFTATSDKGKNEKQKCIHLPWLISFHSAEIYAQITLYFTDQEKVQKTSLWFFPVEGPKEDPGAFFEYLCRTLVVIGAAEFAPQLRYLYYCSSDLQEQLSEILKSLSLELTHDPCKVLITPDYIGSINTNGSCCNFYAGMIKDHESNGCWNYIAFNCLSPFPFIGGRLARRLDALMQQSGAHPVPSTAGKQAL